MGCIKCYIYSQVNNIFWVNSLICWFKDYYILPLRTWDWHSAIAGAITIMPKRILLLCSGETDPWVLITSVNIVSLFSILRHHLSSSNYFLYSDYLIVRLYGFIIRPFFHRILPIFPMYWLLESFYKLFTREMALINKLILCALWAYEDKFLNRKFLHPPFVFSMWLYTGVPISWSLVMIVRESK